MDQKKNGDKIKVRKEHRDGKKWSIPSYQWFRVVVQISKQVFPGIGRCCIIISGCRGVLVRSRRTKVQQIVQRTWGSTCRSRRSGCLRCSFTLEVSEVVVIIVIIIVIVIVIVIICGSSGGSVEIKVDKIWDLFLLCPLLFQSILTLLFCILNSLSKDLPPLSPLFL